MSDAPTPTLEGEQQDAGKQGPSRRELLRTAEADQNLTEQQAEDLLGYYLENQELPGDSDTLDVTVTLGHGDRKRRLTCTIRPITWSEHQDGQDRATSEDGQKFDTFKACSYHVARALVKPQLGAVVKRQQDEAKESDDGKIDGPGGRRVAPPDDAAMLLRRMFHRQSGALLDLSKKVIEISKLGAQTESVNEVDAAKN